MTSDISVPLVIKAASKLEICILYFPSGNLKPGCCFLFLSRSSGS